ncbi:MAG: hypothetical protein ACOC91_00865, partial [bacterium]
MSEQPKTRWDHIRERRQNPQKYDKEVWSEQVSDCMQRLIRHPDGERLMDLLYHRFVFQKTALNASESALRADNAVRNL